MQLVRPGRDHLEGFIEALERGWSSSTADTEATARRELARVLEDPDGYLAALEDREATGPDLVMPDGTPVKRLPGFHRFLWDGVFCGDISLRWQPGTTELPAYCLGHIGYAVVPWKRRLGYATRALAQMLPLAAAEGLPFVEITCDPDNDASRRVIERNGGVFVERFRKLEAYGGTDTLRFRVPLAPHVR